MQERPIFPLSAQAAGVAPAYRSIRLSRATHRLTPRRRLGRCRAGCAPGRGRPVDTEAMYRRDFMVFLRNGGALRGLEQFLDTRLGEAEPHAAVQ
jgi:hypothetical protein